MSLSGHAAPGVCAAFSYQFERALCWLVKSSSGAAVGIETDDDVTVRNEDESRILEQDKHSIQSTAEPFGDRSKDLWNTLANWLEALKANEVKAGKTRFVMVTNKVLPDCIARRIGRAECSAEIDTCISDLEQAAMSPPVHIASLTKAVLDPLSRIHLRSLIRRCMCLDATDDTAGNELRAQSISYLPLPDWCAPHADSLVNELLGWMHTYALENWQQQKPAWITRQHFINQLHAAIDARKRKITRERAEYLIPIGEDKVDEEKGRNGNVFVKQLHLVTQDDSIVDGAIRDFVRACHALGVR